MSYYTAYWKNSTWDRKANEAARGHAALEYAASNQFQRAGVAPGATLIVVTVRKGVLFVAGRIKVAKVLSSKAAAAAHVGRPVSELWEGSHYIVTEPSDVDVFRDGVTISPAVAASLTFDGAGGATRPKLRRGLLDQQTLRNVRRLLPGSERPLLAAVGL